MYKPNYLSNVTIRVDYYDITVNVSIMVSMIGRRVCLMIGDRSTGRGGGAIIGSSLTQCNSLPEGLTWPRMQNRENNVI